MRIRVTPLLVGAMLLASASVAGVLRVEQDGSGEYLLIQDAVNAASDGDTILIGPGRYDDLQPRGFNSVVCVARWDDGRGLTFIGEHRDSVVIGPTSYVPSGTGPQGIHQHEPADLRVENLSFVNLLAGVVASRGVLAVDNSVFEIGEDGVFVQDPLSVKVQNSRIAAVDVGATYGISIFRASEAQIYNCEFINTTIYFGSTPRAVVSDCTVTSGELATFYQSGGAIRRTVAQCTGAFGVSISECDTIRITDSIIDGGLRNVNAIGAGTVVIAERSIFRNPTLTVNIDLGYDVTFIARDNDLYAGVGTPYIVRACCYSVGTSAYIDMSNNYWGEHSNAAALDSLIYDGNDDPNIHVIVNYEPIRTESVPTEQQSLGGLKSLYRGR